MERRGLVRFGGRYGNPALKIHRRYGSPRAPRSGSLNTPRSSQTAHQQYRQAVIMLARAGLGAADVRAMCHAELTAWLQDLLASMGIHSPTGGEVIVSRRLPKPSA